VEGGDAPRRQRLAYDTQGAADDVSVGIEERAVDKWFGDGCAFVVDLADVVEAATGIAVVRDIRDAASGGARSS
jgi:hypothetical protein